MMTAAQHAWVARVLGVEAATDNISGDDAGAELLSRLEIVRDDIAAHRLQKELGAQLGMAEIAVKEGSTQAAGLLDKLESAVAEAVRRKRQQEVVDTIAQSAVSASASVVSFAKARLKLQAARTAHALARSNLRAACEALLKTQQFAGDPRSTAPETRARLAAIGDAVPDFDTVATDLDDTLDRMREAPDPAVAGGLRAGALKAIGAYRHELDADPLLSRMQNTEAGNVPIKDAITAALDELEDALTG